jgi:hypothetical protein
MNDGSAVRPYFAAMRYQHLALVAALGLTVVWSCKKDVEKSAPRVTIITPANGYDLSVPDTLSVSADVSGDDGVDRVVITLANTNGIPVIAPVTVVPSSNPARIEVELALTSDAILTGDYTLEVKGLAGEATGKDYRTVQLLSTPLRLRQILVVSRPDANSIGIHRIDSTGAVSLANTVIMDLGGAVVSSAAQVIVVMGTVQGPLLAFAPDGQQVRWQKPNLGNSGIPWFTSIDLLSDGMVYVGTTDGHLRAYAAQSGSVGAAIDLATGYRSERCVRMNDKVVVAEVDVTGTVRRLAVHLATSGVQVADQVLDKPLMGMFPRDDVHVLLFGNRNGQGVVEDRNIVGGGGWEPYTWPALITAVERVDVNTFLVALANGQLARFTYSNAGSVVIAQLPDIRDLHLEPISGLVYAAAGTEVHALTPQSGQVVGSWPIGAEVEYAMPQLNR